MWLGNGRFPDLAIHKRASSLEADLLTEAVTQAGEAMLIAAQMDLTAC